MRFHNFGCISLVSGEFLKQVRETPESWEKVRSITIFHQNPEKNTLTGLKNPQNCLFFCTSFSDNHGQKSWDTIAFLGRFPIHRGPTPPLTPQTMLDVCIQNFFRVSTLYKVGGGRTARKFRKGGTVLRGNRQMTEKYEYRSTVPRTFVQDCSIRYYGASRPKRWIRTPWECCYRYFYFTDTSVLMFCLYLFVSFCC